MSRHGSGYEEIALFGACFCLNFINFLLILFRLHFEPYSFFGALNDNPFCAPLAPHIFIYLPTRIGVAAIANLSYHCRPNQDQLGDGFDLGED